MTPPPVENSPKEPEADPGNREKHVTHDNYDHPYSHKREPVVVKFDIPALEEHPPKQETPIEKKGDVPAEQEVVEQEKSVNYGEKSIDPILERTFENEFDSSLLDARLEQEK